MAQKSEGQQPLLEAGGKELAVRWRWLWTICLWYVIFCIGVTLGLLGPTLTELCEQLALPLRSSGTLITFRASGYLVGSVWCGDLIERFKNPALVNFMPFFPSFLGLLALPFVTSYPAACSLFLFQGMAMGTLDTGGNVCMLALWRGSPYQNGFVHAFHLAFGVGAAVAPAIVKLLLESGSNPMDAWHVVGAITFPACLSLGLLIAAPQPPTSEEGEAAGDTGKKSELARVVTLTGSFLFVYLGVEVAYGAYIDAFSVRWVHATKVQGAALTSVYWLALSVGRLVAAVVTPYVHHARYLGVHLLLAIVACAILGAATIAPEFAAPPGAGYTWGVVAPTFLYGFAIAPLFPGALLVAEELLAGPMPTRQTGMVVGAAAAGEMALPALVGFFFASQPMNFVWSQTAFCVTTALIFLVNSADVLRSKPAH